MVMLTWIVEIPDTHVVNTFPERCTCIRLLVVISTVLVQP
jgi:hypothetical protein